MRRRLSETLQAAALALTVAAPMSYVLQVAMGITLPVWYTLLFAMLSLLLLELIGWNRITAIALPVGIVVVGAWIWWMLGKENRQAVIDFYWWAMSFLYSYQDYTPANVIILTALTSLLTTLVVWLFGRKIFFFPAVFAFVATVVTIKWLNGLDNVLLPGMIAGGGLILLWAKSHQRKTARKTKKALPENGIALYLLPVVALVVLLSVVALPTDAARSWQSRPVHDLLERVNNFLADYTNFNRPRNSFSIATYGFMPLGDRLGGPTELSEEEVLYVDAPRQMLLRATVYNDYTGASWKDTKDHPRLRFGGGNRATLADTFDTNRPALTGALAAELKQYTDKDMAVHVQPVVDGSSALFVPYRGVTDVASDQFLAILPYFNVEGEVFSSSNIRAGLGYRVFSDYVNYNNLNFDGFMDSLTGMGLRDDSVRAAAISQQYMTLPDNIDPAVYALTNAIIGQPAEGTVTVTDGTEMTVQSIGGGTKLYSITDMSAVPDTDWQKAKAIRSFLLNNFRYTLSPSVPPKDVDFVSYFLLDDGEGYCTYYATAMAVMARIAGIPSRYVEGYMMPDKTPANAEYVIHGNNAHAWAELYFEGIGWIPFDATPSDENAVTGPGGDPGVLEPFPTPTRPPMTEDDNTGDGTLPERRGLRWEDIQKNLWLLPVVTAALLLAWVIWKMVWAKVRVSPRYLARKYQERRRRCAWHYFECLKLLEYYNYPVKPGETPYAYAARIDRWLRLEAGTFTQAADLISRISYSDYAPEDSDVDFLAHMRRQLATYTYHTVGPWFYLWRQVLGFRQRPNRPPDR